jgi:hypothetical protein
MERSDIASRSEPAGCERRRPATLRADLCCGGGGSQWSRSTTRLVQVRPISSRRRRPYPL